MTVKISFTGSRPDKLAGWSAGSYAGAAEMIADRVERILTNVLSVKPGEDVEFFTGGAQGADMLAADAVGILKEKYPDAVHTTIIPFRNFGSSWHDEGIFGKEAAKDRICASDLLSIAVAGNPYGKLKIRDAIFQRNERLAQRCDAMIAICPAGTIESGSGGTAWTAKRAAALGKRVFVLTSGLTADGKFTLVDPV